MSDRGSLGLRYDRYSKNGSRNAEIEITLSTHVEYVSDYVERIATRKISGYNLLTRNMVSQLNSIPARSLEQALEVARGLVFAGNYKVLDIVGIASNGQHVQIATVKAV